MSTPHGNADTAPIGPGGRHVGAPTPRIEDDRLLRGHGAFADDVDLAGQLWMRVVRSTVAHGVVTAIETTAARNAEGVHLVLTGEDVAHLGLIPQEEAGYHEQFPDLEAHSHPILAGERVLYVGQPVAAVFAEDPYLAEDAAELVQVTYAALPPVLDPVRALDDDAPVLHPGFTNEGARFDRHYGDVDGAFATAAHVVQAELRIGRHSGVPMETRNCIADYAPGRGQLSMWGPVHPHDHQKILARMLEMPLKAIHLHHTEIGGSFGTRSGVFPEHVLVPYAARQLRRPVKWVEDRAEHMVANSHAREQVHRIAGAFDDQGRLLGLRDEIWHNKGAYFRQISPLVTDMTVGMVCGPYRVPAYAGTIHAVFTNKTPLTAYRAPGRFEGTFARERLLDLAAAEIGIDRVEIRRRNLLTSSDLPWEPGIEMVGESFRFDSGDVLCHVDHALATTDIASWRAEIERLRAEGRTVGLGVGVLMDKAGLGLYETAEVNVDPGGRIRVLIGGSSVGQGIETVMAQIVADELTVPMDGIDVYWGDTNLVPDGVGSWSSRSTVIGGSAVLRAARGVAAKARRIAGTLLEVDPADVVLGAGRVSVAGVPGRSLTLGEVAAAWDSWTARLAGDEPGLSARDVYLDTHMNYPYGVTLIAVEIDAETGGLTILRFFTTTEAGRTINPLTTRGQIVGAAAQGIGGSLLEEFTYDENGQPQATTFVDYLIPTATDVPPVEILITEDAPTPDNPLRAKGLGEVGLIAVGAAIAGAIDDALGRPGAVTRLPVTPQDLAALLAAGRTTPGPLADGALPAG